MRQTTDCPDRRWIFSIAVLLRTTTLIAFILGWLLLVMNTPPPIPQCLVILVTCGLAVVVGLRRAGSFWTRLKAACFFTLGGIAIAIYSGMVAWTIQEADDPLDKASGVLAVAVSSPLALGTLVLMLRAWTWSAHDWSTQRQAEELKESES